MESERARPAAAAAGNNNSSNNNNNNNNSGGGGASGHEAGAIHGYGTAAAAAAAAVRAVSHTNAAAAAINNNSSSSSSSNMMINSGYTSSSSPAAGAFLFPDVAAATMKKKRGRPRKYGPDSTPRLLSLSVAAPAAVNINNNNNNNININNNNSNNVMTTTTTTTTMTTSGGPGQHAAVVPYPFSPVHPEKRGRGRPPGSGKNQQLAALGELMLGSIGVGFTPHAITIAAGEDIASRIMSFSQQGPRGVCILSANGAISNVTLRQTSISGGAVTYEGRFEILSVSGSFLVTESGDGTRSRTGGLSVSLAGPDGRVIGGSVAGALIAATPVQIVVGSFLNTFKKLHQPKSSKPQASPTGFISSRPMTMHSDLARAFHVDADKSIHAAAEAAAAGGPSLHHSAAADGAISSNSDSSKEYNVVD